MFTSNNRLFSSSITAIFFLAAFLFPVNLFSQEKSSITDIRLWESATEATIIIELTNSVKLSELKALKGRRSFFDIEEATFKAKIKQFDLKSKFLEYIQFEDLSKFDKVRVTFKLPRGIRSQIFMLPKNEHKKERIIVFLRHPKELLNQKAEKELEEVRKLKALGKKIIVIDPGHGGEDPGTSGNGVVEKKYVLSVAHLLKTYIDRDSRFQAFLTRDGDYIIPLEGRRQIAEKLQADAFVSLHVNSINAKSVNGFEVYYESTEGAKNEAARLVAEMENKDEFADLAASDSDSEEKKSMTKTLTDEEKKKLLEKQAQNIHRSRLLAEALEKSMRDAKFGIKSRGVKREGFKVLHSLEMPSALLELGFISNQTEAKVLNLYATKTKIAHSIYQGLADFLSAPANEKLDTAYLNYMKKNLPNLSAAKKEKTHIVAAGENLSTIALKYNVSLSQLLKRNDLGMKSIIRPGQTIIIPE